MTRVRPTDAPRRKEFMATTHPNPSKPRPVDLAAALNALELPTYEELFADLNEHLTSVGYLAAILIDLSEISQIARTQGSRNNDRLMDLVGSEIVHLRRTLLHPQDAVALSEKAGDAFVIFLSPQRASEPLLECLEQLAHELQNALNQRLTSTFSRGSLNGAQVSAGYSLVVHNPLVSVASLLQRAVDEAQHAAYLNRLHQETQNKQRLQHIILEGEIRTVFQPIVDLGSDEVHGFEALARGPRRTALESPQALFDLATKTDLLFELDQVCRRKSVQHAAKLQSPCKLFINTLPFSIRDPHFQGKFLLDLLEESDLLPERIVLEVTETLAIDDYTAYLEEMRYFSDMGFLTGIDDLGTGYSGLERVVELRPDYLKLDMHMVRDIDASVVKQDIMRAFCSMAKNIGAKVVAEGIETKQELDTVRDVGVDYVQGFYLASPSDGFQTGVTLEH